MGAPVALGDVGSGSRSLARSGEAAERARALLPGGLVRPTLNFEPHPVYAQRGEGAYVIDVDGNRYLDLHNNFTALAIGHCHPKVMAALTDQLARGTTFGAPTEAEAELAQLITGRVPSIQRVTFTNSGTEAAEAAVALARAYTGRDLIAKFEGGYHGWDGMYISVRQWPDTDHGSVEQPRTVRNSRGIPQAAADLVVTLPYNDAAAASDVLGHRARDVAAIVVEPAQSVGGGITPEPGFLEGVQVLARQFDIPLIVDEVVTLRLATGGAQQLFGLEPDLTIMGKIIGGGLPVGGVGGRKEILDLLSSSHGPATMFQSGTFAGNPMSMAAGTATLTELTDAAIRRINDLGENLKRDLEQFCRSRDLPVSITGIGSLVNFHFARHPIRCSRDTWTEDKAQAMAFFKAMLNDGFHLTLRCGASLSTPMTDSDLQAFLSAATRNLQRLCAA
jgi:glutamate-1-semialdehyde 2,1-aminomutase